MILPLTHERMTVQRLPWVTIVIIALNLAVFLVAWPQAISDYARMDEAAALFQKLMSGESDPLLRLRAGLALAAFHHQQGRTRQGLSLLDELSPLAASHPEWQSSIDEKRQAFLAVL